MANKKAKKDNKNIIIGACAALVLIIVVVVAIVLATRGPKLDDSFFVSDDTKSVLVMDADDLAMGDDSEGSPNKAYIVYFYSGDNVSDMKSYYEFANESTAKTFFDELKETGDDDSDSYELSGKYIILTADPSEYEGMTKSDAEEQIEFMEMIQSGDYGFDDEEDTDDYDTEE